MPGTSNEERLVIIQDGIIQVDKDDSYLGYYQKQVKGAGLVWINSPGMICSKLN